MFRVSASLFASLLGLIAACSSTATTESSAIVICDLAECDSSAPAAPALSADGTAISAICADGTIAGPICSADSTGTCGWTTVPCSAGHDDPPADCACDIDAPSVPSEICEDGTIVGPTCVATSIGVCEWIITQCPDPQPIDCTTTNCPTGQHCETDCYPCDAPDPKTPCDSFACQSTCVAD